MRSRFRLLVLTFAVLGTTSNLPAHAEVYDCPGGTRGVFVKPGRHDLGTPVPQRGGRVPSHRQQLVRIDQPGRQVRVWLVTPAIHATVGGFAYALVVPRPGIGICVGRHGDVDVRLATLGADALQRDGTPVPLLEFVVPMPVETNAVNCRGVLPQGIQLPTLPLRDVKVEVRGSACKMTARIGPS